jgi:hypothetical protein
MENTRDTQYPKPVMGDQERLLLLGASGATRLQGQVLLLYRDKTNN